MSKTCPFCGVQLTLPDDTWVTPLYEPYRFELEYSGPLPFRDVRTCVRHQCREDARLLQQRSRREHVEIPVWSPRPQQAKGKP